MIVFGDHVRQARIADCLRHIIDECCTVKAMAPGIERHGKLCGSFILAGELVQGVADRDLERSGHDDTTQAQSTAMDLLMRLAALVDASWTNGFIVPPIMLDAAKLESMAAGGTVLLRQPEGYAHYALYPESFALAARSLRLSQANIIGLRSIGCSLAAIVAVALGSSAPSTVRPIGHPFQRELCLSPALAERLKAGQAIPHVVVDEGPGLSGSSFGAVTSWLADAGIPEQNIICLPSHDGLPGSMASVENRLRYARLRKASISFNSLVLHTEVAQHRLDTWFADLVGAAIEPLQDLSGGAWRNVRRLDVPIDAQKERRKFLLQTALGTFLLKFIGLGAIGAAKWQRAKRLAEHGCIPEPLGFRHGFLIERWHAEAGAPGERDAAPIGAIGTYLGTRARLFPAEQGADLATLAAMARHNTEEALGTEAARALRFNTNLAVRAIHVDARLHRWEWLVLAGGRLLKTDALDHSAGHDLIGCQDVAWDIAGATVEWDLCEEDVERLRRIVCVTAGIEVDPALVADCIKYYCGFQLGLWQGAAAERYRYRLEIERQDVLF